MSWVLEIKENRRLFPPSPPHYLFFQPPPPPPTPLSSSQSGGFNLNNKVSPSILIIIIILAIIFFISGLLHLLVRFLLRPPTREPDEMDDVTALQGQLQQLFHLHDAGVDQSFIDTLPVFNYKAIVGAKDPFDCAVCLCEFEVEDKLRLLPKCCHAFHVDCIDTWLLSHSTCPLCRSSLLPDFSTAAACSPIVHVLESGGESSREIVADREVTRVTSHLSSCSERYEYDSKPPPHADLADNCRETQAKDDEIKKRNVESTGEKVVSVKLGKFRNLDSRSEENADPRRCFSMGSFAYVMDGNSSLQVAVRSSPVMKQLTKQSSLPSAPLHRQAMSECGFDTRMQFEGFEAFRILEIRGDDEKVVSSTGNKSIGNGIKESFSVSKIWLRDRKDRPNEAAMESSRRAFSFRIPANRSAAAYEFKPKNGGGGCGGARRTISEMGISRWKIGGSEMGREDEILSCNSLDSDPNPPSFARKTLLWIMGRQSKVVHSSMSTHV